MKREAIRCACAWLFFAALVSGCTRKETAPAPNIPQSQAAASSPATETKDAPGATASSAAAALKGGGNYEVTAVANTGALSVTAVYTGDSVPDATEVPVNIDVPVCGHKVFTETLFVDKETRGLKNVVVRLEGITKGKAPPQVVTVTNHNCAFEPHVGVAVKGTKIEIRNADPVLHTTHPYLAGSSFFSLPLPVGSDPPQARPIPRTGLMEINCDVHKWMRGYIIVHTNPYLDVTDKLGKLKIEDIPPGKYPFVAWHESLGEKKGEIEIVAGKPAELRLEFAATK